MNTDDYRLKPNHEVHLDQHDASDNGKFDDKHAGEKALKVLNQQLEEYQERLYAQARTPLLIVLQGMDTSGKDGTIRHVFEGVNPQGVRVANFKAPTPQEMAHDYLWRVHQKTPARGEIVIFNRSHYEDVLIVRVHNLVPKAVWKQRFEQINDFERMLAQEGAVILKFFLHISYDEQRQRLLDRLQEPDKHWKFNPEDLKERAYWDDYIHAYEDMLARTSTAAAPWYIIPANRKWFRNVLVAQVIVDALKAINPVPPPALDNLDQYREQLVNA